MGNSLLDFAMLIGVAIGGYLLLTRMKSSPSPSPSPSPSTPEPTTPFVPAAPTLDKKFNLSNCEATIDITKVTRTKAECISVGSKHGVVITYSDGKRCTVKCSSIAGFTPALKKQLKIDKCKCNALDRADLEAELLKTSSYARAYKVFTYSNRRLN